jgi:hypothetical protein
MPRSLTIKYSEGLFHSKDSGKSPTMRMNINHFLLIFYVLILILNVNNEFNDYSDCGTPLNVTNGNLNYIGTTFGSTASLACDRGYDGNGTISCLDTGSWETPPNCSIKG